MNNLKKITVRVEEEKLEQARLVASRLGFSLNSYINYFLSVVTVEKNDACDDSSEGEIEFKAKWRLTESQHTMLKKVASANGWSISKEAKFRLISSLSKTSALYPDEVHTLRGLRSAVDSVGRSLHYIIVGKKKVVVDDPDFKKDIEMLTAEMKVIKSRIDKLTESTINRNNFRIKSLR